MKILTLLFVVTILSLFSFNIFAQDVEKDVGKFKTYKNELWQKIKKSADEYNKKEKEPREVFKMDFSGYDLPTAVDQFTQQWYNPPI